MGKYSITYSCGHTSEIELFGKISDRESRIEWLEKNGVCPDCYKADREKEVQSLRVKMAIQAAEDGLFISKLEGTPKQIVWASAIRTNWLSAIYARLNGKPVPWGRIYAERPDEWKKITNASAKYWIEARGARLWVLSYPSNWQKDRAFCPA